MFSGVLGHNLSLFTAPICSTETIQSRLLSSRITAGGSRGPRGDSFSRVGSRLSGHPFSPQHTILRLWAVAAFSICSFLPLALFSEVGHPRVDLDPDPRSLGAWGSVFPFRCSPPIVFALCFRDLGGPTPGLLTPRPTLDLCKPQGPTFSCRCSPSTSVLQLCSMWSASSASNSSFCSKKTRQVSRVTYSRRARTEKEAGGFPAKEPNHLIVIVRSCPSHPAQPAVCFAHPAFQLATRAGCQGVPKLFSWGTWGMPQGAEIRVLQSTLSTRVTPTHEQQSHSGGGVSRTREGVQRTCVRRAARKVT